MGWKAWTVWAFWLVGGFLLQTVVAYELGWLAVNHVWFSQGVTAGQVVLVAVALMASGVGLNGLGKQNGNE